MPAVKALATCPEMFAAGTFVNPAPDPINLPLVVTLPTTSRYNKSSTTCRLEYSTLELNVVPVNAAAEMFVAVMPVKKAPLPIK